jgi:glycosyltransferase involved in cell wall biosynthesis
MKIVLPVHHFPPGYSAGAELYTYRLARALRARDHDIEVVCIEAIDQGGVGDIQATRDHYDGIPVWRIALNLVDDRQRALHSFDHPALQGWFRSYFGQSEPDLVHLQAGYLLGVAPLHAAHDLGIPTVLTLHDYWFLCPRITLLRGDGSLCQTIPEDPAGCAWCVRLESRRYRWSDQVSNGMAGTLAQTIALHHERRAIAQRRNTLLPALHMPDAIIAPSQFLADRFAPHVPADRLRVSRYGLDLAPFRQQQRPAPDGVLRIGYIGQIAPHKGVHLLIDAFRRLQAPTRKIELHIYGGLDAQPAYAARLRHLAGNDRRIVFGGRIANNRVPATLMRFDVSVAPSIWYENSPLAIMEAHAAGTPVVTAALGGMAELVWHNIDGLHFKAGDATDLLRQLQRLIDEPHLVDHLRGGIATPRSIEDEMTGLLHMYRSLVPQQVAVPEIT